MEDIMKSTEQEEFEKILSHYDKPTQQLYFEILKMYSDMGTQMSKSMIKNEILDKVKGVVG
ncbi:MAG: hypothetical protein BGN88_09435 [Clostridiales bacterium 43-6]|nr:MAG: hypothetical protein BGN88_09435 [Clostridiales bacterium 43-6]